MEKMLAKKKKDQDSAIKISAFMNLDRSRTLSQ